MAFDFPSNPSPGQEFVADSGLTYIWDTVAWNRKAAPPLAPPTPTPTISSLNPNTVTADGAAHTIRVMGTDFQNDSTVFVDNVLKTSTFVNATEMTTSVIAPTVETDDSFMVKSIAPSNEVGLVFTTPPVAPRADSLNPASGWNTWTNIVITMSGSNFLPQTKVTWNGTNVDNTVVVSANQMTFTMDLSAVPLGNNYVNARTDAMNGSGPDIAFAVSY